MSVEEILKKEVFNVNDIIILFGVGTTRAYKIIKDIRSFSDRINITGRVHRKDYEDYINRFDKVN